MADDEKLSPRMQEIAQQYAKEQETYWSAFRDEIDKLQGYYRIPTRDIAAGLRISAQTLYDFKPKKGEPKINRLNIDRANILTLWSFLTDPEVIQRLSGEKQERRRELEKRGVDSLLKAAGFLPTTTSSEPDIRGVDLSVPEVRRVVSRLSSKWIQDSEVRTYLTNNFLDQIVDRGRLKNPDAKQLNETEALNWPETMKYLDREVNEKYTRQIKRLVVSGKTDFFETELFELYQSVLENEILNQPNISETIDILDCQFETLSAKTILSEYKALREQRSSLQDYIEALVQRAEIKLIGISEPDKEENFLSKDLRKLIANPVIEALIECEYIQDGEIKDVLQFRFASTSTHIENMLYAFRNGLGYTLKISGFFMRATGSNENSLSRVMMTLTEESNLNGEVILPEGVEPETFQGWWVESNTLIGILKSVFNAVRRWLIKKLDADASTFYEICRSLAEVNKKFFELQSELYESTPTYAESKYNLNQEIEQFIQDSENLKVSKQKIFENAGNLYIKHTQDLENRIAMAKLMRMRAALVEADLDKANLYTGSMLHLSSLSMDEIQDPYKFILSVYAVSCLMLRNIIIGDAQFLIGRHWRLRVDHGLSSCIEKLQEYRKKAGVLDFDLYSCASHIFGMVGQLELYTTSLGESKFMNEGADCLIQAAHFASRIGQLKHAAQWLAYASRIYCRLGDASKAESLCTLANQFLPRDPQVEEEKEEEKTNYPTRYINWPSVYLDLANGERFLLQGSYEKAEECLFKALEPSIKFGFAKIFPDIIYNLSRVIYLSQDKKLLQPIKEALSKALQLNPNNSLFKERIEIIRRLHDSSTDLQSFMQVSNQEAQNIWNKWAGASGKHPFSSEMETYQFLSFVVAK